jgi:hypothetical protein
VAAVPVAAVPVAAVPVAAAPVVEPAAAPAEAAAVGQVEAVEAEHAAVLRLQLSLRRCRCRNRRLQRRVRGLEKQVERLREPPCLSLRRHAQAIGVVRSPASWFHVLFFLFFRSSLCAYVVVVGP